MQNSEPEITPEDSGNSETSSTYEQAEADEVNENDIETNLELETMEAMNTDYLDAATVDAVDDASTSMA